GSRFAEQERHHTRLTGLQNQVHLQNATGVEAGAELALEDRTCQRLRTGQLSVTAEELGTAAGCGRRRLAAPDKPDAIAALLSIVVAREDGARLVVQARDDVAPMPFAGRTEPPFRVTEHVQLEPAGRRIGHPQP